MINVAINDPGISDSIFRILDFWHTSVFIMFMCVAIRFGTIALSFFALCNRIPTFTLQQPFIYREVVTATTRR